jgi:hypothetical protein
VSKSSPSRLPRYTSRLPYYTYRYYLVSLITIASSIVGVLVGYAAVL